MGGNTNVQALNEFLDEIGADYTIPSSLPILLCLGPLYQQFPDITRLNVQHHSCRSES